MSLSKFAMYWSTDNSDISSIDETSTNTLDTALLDLSGFSNTSAIVLHYGENANISSTGIAGVYWSSTPCNNYGAWANRIEDGTMYPSGNRKDQNAVSCFLAIN